MMNTPSKLPRLDAPDEPDPSTVEDVTEHVVEDDDEATRIQSPDPKTLEKLRPPIPREDPE